MKLAICVFLLTLAATVKDDATAFLPSLTRRNGAQKQTYPRCNAVSDVAISDRLDLGNLSTTRKSLDGEPPSRNLDFDFSSTNEMNLHLSHICTRDKSRNFARALQILAVVESGSLARVKPNHETYEKLLEVAASLRLSIDVGEALFSHMEAFCGSPSVAAANSLISMYNAMDQRKAPNRAEKLLEQMWTIYEQSGADPKFLPNLMTYKVAMLAVSSHPCRHPDFARRTEAILEDMERRSKQHPFLKPNESFVNIVLAAWSNSKSKDAPKRCLEILSKMKKLSAEGGRPELQPSTISYNTILKCLSRRARNENNAEDLLLEMGDLSKKSSFPCEPDTRSFNSVITAWAASRRKNGPQRAEDILWQMETRFLQNLTSVAPDETSYGKVIHAWAKSKYPFRLKKAMRVLDSMKRSHKEGNICARPTVLIYNTALDAIVKSEDGTKEHAFGIMEEMKAEGLQPDKITYTTLLSQLSKERTIQAADLAIEILDDMEDEYARTKRTDMKPNLMTYTAAIKVLARNRTSAEKAVTILDRMEAAGIEPDTAAFNVVINALGHSGLQDKVQRVKTVFDRMVKSYEDGNMAAKPDIIACNAILNACIYAHSGKKPLIKNDEAIMMAVEIFELFRTSAPMYGWPNQDTFTFMMFAIHNLMDFDERQMNLAEATFWYGADSGHVSKSLIYHLHDAVSKERLTKMLGDIVAFDSRGGFKLHYDKVPEEWRRFVSTERTRRI